jgi:hypothetical protein
LIGEVGGADFAFGVAGVEPGEHAGEAGGVEAVVAGQEPPADPVERVVLAASVTQGGLLGAAADLVERRVWRDGSHGSGARGGESTSGLGLSTSWRLMCAV